MQDDVEWFQTVGQYAAEPPAWTRLYDKTRTRMKIAVLIAAALTGVVERPNW